MKTCKEYREMFDAYIDRELLRIDRMELEAHCEECPECARELSELQKLFDNEVYAMPHSVSDKIMDRVKASTSVDFFTGEDQSEEQKLAAAKKAKKKEGMKAWGIIAACFVLFITGSIFTKIQKKNYEKQHGLDKAQTETVEDASNENAPIISLTGNEARQKLYDAIYLADRLEVKFLTSKVSLYERFYIEYFSRYVSENDCVRLDGIKLTDRSIGYIKTDPEDGLDIIITDKHKIVFNYAGTIYQLETDSDELLYALEGLGLHA